MKESRCFMKDSRCFMMESRFMMSVIYSFSLKLLIYSFSLRPLIKLSSSVLGAPPKWDSIPGSLNVKERGFTCPFCDSDE